MSFTGNPTGPLRLLYDDPEGAFTLQARDHFVGGEWFTHIHFEVFYWSPSTLKEIDRIFDRLRADLPPIIGAYPREPSRTFDRFVKRYGFEQIGEIPHHDGVVRPHYIHIR